jgi:hypothetical protein
LAHFSLDDQQNFTAETIEIRKMSTRIESRPSRLPTTNDIELLMAELIFSSLAADSES